MDRDAEGYVEPEWCRAARADGFDMDDPFDAVAVAAFIVGPNIKRIASELGRPRAWVAPAARRLREGGAWRGRYLNAEGGDGVGIEAALHSAVARGWIEMVPAD